MKFTPSVQINGHFDSALSPAFFVYSINICLLQPKILLVYFFLSRALDIKGGDLSQGNLIKHFENTAFIVYVHIAV